MATEDPRASEMDDPLEGSRELGANLAKEIEKTARRRNQSTRGKKSIQGDPSTEGDSSDDLSNEEGSKSVLLRKNRSYVNEDEVLIEEDDLWNFPRDREQWSEEDLGETWLEYYGQSTLAGYDAELENPLSEEDEDEEQSEFAVEEDESDKPKWAPFYVPFKKFYPTIPNNHPDIETPEDAVEELERMEEFLTWTSYIFQDGSSYEGTAWDDMAHGKGVYTTAAEICRYEGEWLQNMMQGHGVLEIDIPVSEPMPDSEGAEKMRQDGVILKSDYMNPFDKEWLKMDAEDNFKRWSRHTFQAFEDDPYWSENFDEMPEKGHYKYAGQMKHNRMHGCGVYEINGRSIWGKFYFGELLPDPEECTHEISAFHASMAEVAAAKARMFVNKPDGMVRVARGPYNDPQHPYMYEEEDLWMAPGSINAYYKVPDPWKLYVEDVDKEREMWLNSFIKSPLRIPMPPELEYWWAKEDEFILLGNTPSIVEHYDPETVAKSGEDFEGEVLLHVPTGQVINWASDEEGKLRFFIQPLSKDGTVMPEEAQALPLGFDEFLAEDPTVQVANEEVEKEKEKVKEEKKAMKKTTKVGLFWDRFKQKAALLVEEQKMKRELAEESLKARWEMEDKLSERQKELKKAEKRITERIENADLNAKYRELFEEIFDEIEDEKKVLNEADEAEKKQIMDGDAVKEGGEKGKDNNDDDDEDDDDDDKKPRSFGKVASVGFIEPCLSGDGKECNNGVAPKFPTAFASLTLGTQAAIFQMPKSKIRESIHGWFPRLGSFLNPCMKGSPNLVEAVLDMPMKEMGFVRFANAHYDFERKGFTLKSKSGGLRSLNKCQYMGEAYRKKSNREPIEKRLACSLPNRSDGIWNTPPEHAFLSLAIPVTK